jgi:hypothetical protein
MPGLFETPRPVWPHATPLVRIVRLMRIALSTRVSVPA